MNITIILFALWLGGVFAFTRGILRSSNGKVERHIALISALFWPLFVIIKPHKALAVLGGKLTALENATKGE